MSPRGWGGQIDFGADPVVVGVGFGVCGALSENYFVNQWLDSYQIFMDI